MKPQLFQRIDRLLATAKGMMHQQTFTISAVKVKTQKIAIFYTDEVPMYY